MYRVRPLGGRRCTGVRLIVGMGVSIAVRKRSTFRGNEDHWPRVDDAGDSGFEIHPPRVFRCLMIGPTENPGQTAPGGAGATGTSGSFFCRGDLVTDSMHGVVDRWECDHPILNIRFVDFAACYRFGVHYRSPSDRCLKGEERRSPVPSRGTYQPRRGFGVRALGKRSVARGCRDPGGFALTNAASQAKGRNSLLRNRDRYGSNRFEAGGEYCPGMKFSVMCVQVVASATELGSVAAWQPTQVPVAALQLAHLGPFVHGIRAHRNLQ